MSTRKYLSDKQVAERYGVSRVTVWRWARETDFPNPISFPGRVTRWSVDSIEAYERLLDPSISEGVA